MLGDRDVLLGPVFGCHVAAYNSRGCVAGGKSGTRFHVHMEYFGSVLRLIELVFGGPRAALRMELWVGGCLNSFRKHATWCAVAILKKVGKFSYPFH
ncbi:hypothetical protein NDU88_004266 [Pleurodeles waltl]|uniref:Uncharacterized protein n=1 Tax=Pleurodeles waltl TaxID=8319 RepID=A0AAV7KZG8_PLEWA|nr:hypothetical protein NDU88_004266 [Pleurodeles waltl]